MNTNLAVNVSHALLRVVAGLLFFQAGAMKILGWFGGMPGDRPSPPPLTSQVGIGGLLELVGGFFIILGLFTRPVAFLLSGEMAVAYWQFHAPNGAWPIQNQGESAVLLCFIFLLFAAAGAGEWSADALIRRKRDGAKDASS